MYIDVHWSSQPLAMEFGRPTVVDRGAPLDVGDLARAKRADYIMLYRMLL